MPIGTSQEINVDVRIVATTNRNMLDEVKEISRGSLLQT